MFCEIHLQPVAHITMIHNLFIYFIFKFFLTDPQSLIVDPWSSILIFQINLEVLLMKIILFFNHWSNQLFQTNPRFQLKPLDIF